MASKYTFGKAHLLAVLDCHFAPFDCWSAGRAQPNTWTTYSNISPPINSLFFIYKTILSHLFFYLSVCLILSLHT